MRSDNVKTGAPQKFVSCIGIYGRRDEKAHGGYRQFIQ